MLDGSGPRMYVQTALALLQMERKDVQKFLDAFHFLSEFPDRDEFLDVNGRPDAPMIFSVALDVIKSPAMHLAELGRQKGEVDGDVCEIDTGPA